MKNITAVCRSFFVLVALGTVFLFHAEHIGDELQFLKRSLFAPASAIRGMHFKIRPEDADFFYILSRVNALVPAGKEVQLILPEKPAKRAQYLMGKGRFMLYPRNYGDNARAGDYILVYKVSDVQPPGGYRVIENFADDKYLMVRQ